MTYRQSWEHLLQLIEHRDKKLQAAGEIHRFHRDVAESLSRIHEKDAALSNDLARDLNSAVSLLRRHEGFENDLVALEVQLQLLIDDAQQLQVKYPKNAAQILQRQDQVVAAWNELSKRASFRRDQLQASCDLQKFISQVRDLLNWASNLRTTMMAEDKIRDLATAQALKTEHEALKNEIEAREETFRAVLDLGEAMIQTDHYAAQDAEEKNTLLIDERIKLHNAWQTKKVWLDQQIDLQCFLRDAKQVEHTSSLQEAALGNCNKKLKFY